MIVEAMLAINTVYTPGYSQTNSGKGDQNYPVMSLYVVIIPRIFSPLALLVGWEVMRYVVLWAHCKKPHYTNY